jgi:LacI family transcriptional regulator
VSRTTVSFVLNNRADAAISPQTRRRVREAAERLGYHANAPARQLAAGMSQTIGLVLRQSPEHLTADALLPDTLRGLTSAARGENFRVLVEPVSEGARSYLDLVQSRLVDGVVVSGPRRDDDALRKQPAGVPIVLQGSLDGSAIASVDIDNRSAARAAVEHLIGLGHRRIGCITNAPLVFTAAYDRAAGYRDALAHAGLPFDASLLIEGDHDAGSGKAAMREVLAAGSPPDAVFVASDIVAFGVIDALRDTGLRVPTDVSVVGFDDIPLAAFSDPPLTTIRVPAFDIGAAAGRVLLDIVAGRAVERETRLPAPLIVRASTAQRSESPSHKAARSPAGAGA